MNYFDQESERLRYRKVNREDIPQWRKFYDNNDMLPYLGLDLTKSKDVLATEWIEKQFDRYEASNCGYLAVIDKENNELIGLGGILHQEVMGKMEYEIAYSVLPEHWNKGYASEIVLQMKAYGKETKLATRMISLIHLDNDASAKVVQKNGMKPLFFTEFQDMDVCVFGFDLDETAKKVIPKFD